MSDIGLFEERQIKARQLVTRRGDPGKRVFLIVEGSIQVSGHGEAEMYGPGRIFGRLDLVTGGEDAGGYRKTTTAITEATIRFADASQLRAEIEKASPTLRALVDHALNALD